MHIRSDQHNANNLWCLRLLYDPQARHLAESCLCNVSYPLPRVLRNHSGICEAANFWDTIHRFLWLNVPRHKIVTVELRMYSGLNTNIWYAATCSTHLKNDVGGFSLRDNFPPGLSRISILSKTSLLSLILGNIRFWYSFEIRHGFTTYTFTCGHVQFYFENLISPLISRKQIWYASRDVHPWNTTIFGSNFTE